MATIVLLLVILLPNVAECLGHRTHNRHFAIFVFGDSLYDPGNNNFIDTTPDFQADFPPYGESFFDHPTGRFSDGRLICDFIAEFAKLPLIPAYMHQSGNRDFSFGANFASGGAGALVETHAPYVIDLKTQIRYFKDLERQLRHELGDSEADVLFSNAVYLFSCGGNDYLSPASVYQSYTQEQYVDLVMGNLTEAIKDVYEKNGRKFGFMTVPHLGCWPSVRAQQPGNTCLDEATTVTVLHNKALSENLKKLEKQLNGFMYSLFDLSTAVDDRMENPLEYGFKEGNMACCGSGPYHGIYSCGGKRGQKDYQLCDNPSGYFFFDSNHPGESACLQLAELFWHGDFTVPRSLKSLFEKDKGDKEL